MAQFPQSARRSFFAAVLVLGVSLFFYLALNTHWADSELWSLGVSRDLQGAMNEVVTYKPLFHGYLALPYLFDLGNHATVNFARLQFAIVGLLTILFVFLFSKLVTGSRDSALWVTATFATTTLFFSQGFKIRSDVLACLFQLAAVSHCLWLCQRTKPVGWLEFAAGFLLQLITLLVTPKAVFHLAVNFSFILSFWRLNRDQPSGARARSYFLISLAGLSLPAMAVLFWKRHEFASAFEFFLHSYQSGPMRPDFWSREAWVYIENFFVSQWYLGILAFAAFFLPQAQKRAELTAEKAVGVAALVASVLILAHSDRLPFFILSLLPFPLLFVVLRSLRWWTVLRGLRHARLALGFLVFAVLVNLGIFLRGMIADGSNHLQVEAQQIMERVLAEYSVTEYYDGTIVLPRQNLYFAFPSPQHEGNWLEIERLIDSEFYGPSLFFFANRLFYYVRPLYSLLEKRFYIQVGPGVFARSKARRGRHVWSEVEWRRTCVFAPKGQVYAYQGSSFLDMKLFRPEPFDCSGPPPKLAITAEFMAFSPFAPISMPGGKSFAQIFDYDPRY
jgi:hypothetical protein